MFKPRFGAAIEGSATFVTAGRGGLSWPLPELRMGERVSRDGGKTATADCNCRQTD
jgi:hypothetical protein